MNPMKLTIPNLFELLFPLLVCSLYLPPVFYSVFTAILTILAGIALGQGYKINFRQPLPWIFIGFFLVHLNGLVIGGSAIAVLKGIQSKVSFLLLPFILMVFQPLLTRSFFRKLIAAFFYSSLLISIVFLLISVNNLLDDYQRLLLQGKQDQLQWFRYFYSSILTHGYIHRSYLGLMLGMALISSPFVAPIQKTKRFFFFLAVTLLLFVLFLLQSRMILIAFLVSQVLYVIIRIIQTRSGRWATYLGIGLLVIAGLGYFFADSPYNRFRDTEISKYDMTNPKEDYSGATIRFAIWENSVHLIQEHPIWGVGYGNLDRERLEVYKDNQFKKGLTEEFNSHNQFLETQVVAGIPGSALLLGMIIAIWTIAIKRGDAHLFILSVFLFLSMLTEAMFERQLAIALFCSYVLALALGEKVGFRKERPT